MISKKGLKIWFRRITRTVFVVAMTLFAIRIYDTQRGSPLEPWHTFVPHELSAKEITEANWGTYLQAEQRIFDEVKRKVTDKLPLNSEYALNRYASNSAIYSTNFAHDWNRSYLLEPQGKPKGVAVLLHGLTDSPYSLRHIATHYQQRGFIVVGIRMPAHGTVPAALTKVRWEAWFAATKLAVREAKNRVADAPLHIVGYSNGGALAVMYALEAIDNPALAKADQLILISPMIGVTSFARFAGLASLPAIFPPFAKASWVDIYPEYNPFKYNSFPVNGARQSYELTNTLQKQILAAQTAKKLQKLPPILTFQSVVDATVSAPSVVSALYNLLPNNNQHQLVLFDVNRTVNLGPLLRPNADAAAAQLLPVLPRAYQTTVITNASPQSHEAVAYITKANAVVTQTTALSLVYPPDIYSLSHIALPFPDSDSLYGRNPEVANEFGVSFGILAIRGERGVLVTSLDSLLRISYNPFYSYLIQLIDQKIDETPTAPDV